MRGAWIDLEVEICSMKQAHEHQCMTLKGGEGGTSENSAYCSRYLWSKTMTLYSET
jgi:hypothetical protein